MDDSRMPLGSHLEELRRRLIVAGASWLVAFLACYAFAEKLFDLIAEPIRQALPAGSSLVFVHATEPFFTYLKISALAGLLIALPIIFWQLWGFVAPGLYAHEKRYAVPFVVASSLCFALGALFGYRFVFPMGFKVLLEFGLASGEIQAMLSMGSYLSLSSKLLLAFGLVFELPIVIFFLARMGLVDHLMLRRNRKFALLAAFLIGAMLTPPDVFSQSALALPFIILYEISIWIARFFGKKQEAADTDEAGSD
ncbi:MAG: twin-arginine translocase subunit TatC [Desulfuromonadales bacterium]|nr:twin-arginine translocase subunit TatC [Desulfuromonadales bacterium]